MYNIRIKQLPKNGDQRNYSLVDRNDLYIKVNPINQDSNVKNTISAVPREEANIEAEGGETVIGDINNDGFLEHNKIVGKRHTEGGVPLNVAPGSFIFSDTKKLKIKDPEVLSIFGITNIPKGGITPAKIANKYPMNNYMNILKDDTTDPISKRTASKMLENSLEKLGMLALVQESMKGFPDGIPAIAESVMAGMQGPEMQGAPQEMMEGQESSGQEMQMRYGGIAKYQAGSTTTEPQTKKLPGKKKIEPKPYVPTNTYRVGPDASKGYFDRVADANIFRSDSRDVVDPRMEIALQKVNPFSDKVEGVGDYFGNLLSMPQKEVNNLLTGYYESPMDTKSRYSEVSDSEHFWGDVATDPMMYPELPIMLGKGAVKLTGKAVQKAVPYAREIAQLTAKYGSQAARFLSQYIGKMPFEQLLSKGYLVANRIGQAGMHAVGDDTKDQSYDRIIPARINGKDAQIGRSNGKWYDTYTGKEVKNIGTYAPNQNMFVNPIQQATPIDTTTVEQDRTQRVVIKEDNGKPAVKTTVSSNTNAAPKTTTDSKNTPAKRVSGKMQSIPNFIIPSGKFKGQQGSAFKMGDTLRVFFPDGTYETSLNGKIIPGYRYGGDLPKHQGLEGPSTVGGGSGSMMDDGSSSGFFGRIGDFFNDLFSGDDTSSSDSAASSLDQQAIAAASNSAAPAVSGTSSANTNANNSVIQQEYANAVAPRTSINPASLAANAATAQGIQNGSVKPVSTGDPTKQVIANNTHKYEIEPSSVNKLPMTPKSKSTYAPFRPENYDKVWIPMAQQAMSTEEGRKAIDDYLTNVASKGKYGPNILAALKGLTGQARYDKILQLATDGDPGEFHNAFRDAIIPKPAAEPEVVETPAPAVGEAPVKKRAWSCRKDPDTGEKTIYEFEYEGEMPSGSYATQAEAEVGCNAKPQEPEQPKAKKRWWVNDDVIYAGTATDTVNYYPPAMSQVNLDTPRYALGDPDRRIAAMQEAAAAEREAAYNTTAGNVAGASQVAPSNQTLGQAANIIGTVENENANIFNQFSGNIAGINNQERLLNEQLKQKYIEQSATARQQYDNAKRDLKWRRLDAWNNGQTNMQKTNQLESLFPQYEFDRISGDLDFTKGRLSYDENGRPYYDTYVNPLFPNSSSSNNGYISGAQFKAIQEDLMLNAGLTKEQAYEATLRQIGKANAAANSSQKTSMADMLLAGKTTPSPLPKKNGGIIKKEYGGVVFDFGALPLYFFED